MAFVGHRADPFTRASIIEADNGIQMSAGTAGGDPYGYFGSREVLG